MLFGFGHLVSVMSAIHDKVDPATVEARLKYLQRVPFPAPRGDVGKGGRTYYSAEDLMKLVVVFELIAASILPAQAAALVTERWSEIANGLGRAWQARSDAGTSLLMLATPNPFDLSSGGAGHIDIVSADELGGLLKDRRDVGRRMGPDRHSTLERRVTLVDLISLADALDGALSPAVPAPVFAEMAQELDVWVRGHQRVGRTRK